MLSERGSSENRDSGGNHTSRPNSKTDERMRTPIPIGKKYDMELARKVSKRIRALRYLRDTKSSRIRHGTSRLEVPTETPLQ